MLLVSSGNGEIYVYCSPEAVSPRRGMLVSPLIILPLANVHFINPRVEREAGGLLLTNAGLNPSKEPCHHHRVGGGTARAKIGSLGLQRDLRRELFPTHKHTLSPGP